MQAQDSTISYDCSQSITSSQHPRKIEFEGKSKLGNSYRYWKAELIKQFTRDVDWSISTLLLKCFIHTWRRLSLRDGIPQQSRSFNVGSIVVWNVVVIIVSGFLGVLWKRVMEGGKSCLKRTGSIRPVPLEFDGLRETPNYWKALIGYGSGVSILVAHHDKSISIDCKLLVEFKVASL